MTGAARNSGENPTDTMVRAMDTFGDRVEKVVVITLQDDGEMCMFSNASTEAEMRGMLHVALFDWKVIET